MAPRYKTLALTSAILFAFYYVYDMPAALNKHLNLGDGFGARKITLLYSVYAFPNMILPIFFGWKSDIRFPHIGAILCFFVFIGQVLFSIGVFRSSFILMMIGRFIYGVGGESFTVIQNKIIADKFRGNELAFSMSISTSIGRCGTVFNYLITPFLAKYFNVSLSTSFGCVLTFVGLIFCIFTVKEKERYKFFTDKVKETVVNVNLDKPINEKEINTVNKSLEDVNKNKFETEKLPDLFQENDQFVSQNEDCDIQVNELYDLRGGTYYPRTPHNFDNGEYKGIDLTAISQLVEESDPWTSSNEDITEERPFHGIADVNKSFPATTRKNLEFERPVNIFTRQNRNSEIVPEYNRKGLGIGFSLLVGISFMFAVAWAPFSSVATIMLQKRYDVTSIYAGRLMATQEGISIVLTVVFGYLADLYGYKLFLTAIGSLMLIIAHCIIFFVYKSSLLPIIILGISGPLISCYWPCITYLVSSENLTKGFATFTCILNIAYTFSPLMVSTLISKDDTYDTVEFFIISVSSMAFIFIVLLGFLNSKFGLKLNRKSFD